MPMPSVPTLTPRPKRGRSPERGRGRNCATPSSPSPAKPTPDDRTTSAQRIIENRRMSKPPGLRRSFAVYRSIRLSSLLPDHVGGGSLVLGADEFDQFLIRHDLLVEPHGERRCVRFR